MFSLVLTFQQRKRVLAVFYALFILLPLDQICKPIVVIFSNFIGKETQSGRHETENDSVIMIGVAEAADSY